MSFLQVRQPPSKALIHLHQKLERLIPLDSLEDLMKQVPAIPSNWNNTVNNLAKTSR